MRDIARKYPDLRTQFETSGELVRRARARAERVAQETAAMRELLQTRAREIRASGNHQHDIWQAAAHAAAASARDRDRTLGVLSHELRQALGAAMMAERVLVNDAGSEAAKRAGAVLERQLQHLTRLVEALLDYSRVTTRQMEAARERVDLCDVVRQSLEAIEPGAIEKGLELDVQLPADPQIVIGDPTRLRQAISNVLHNAVQYTPSGGRVECSVTRGARDVAIAVRDNGPGLEAADRDRVFEPFTRGTHSGPGLGIGLALARRIAELHGGGLSVSSDGRGCGSTFTVSLPIAPSRE